jgi:hypothetical protein
MNAVTWRDNIFAGHYCRRLLLSDKTISIIDIKNKRLGRRLVETSAQYLDII